MQVDIYVDVLFVVNLLMNYVLLWFTGVFTRSYYKAWRLLLGGAAGALYAVGIFFVPLAFVYGLLGKVAMSAAMVVIAFGFRYPKRLLRILGVFYACTFTLSGIGFALFYFSDVGYRLGAVLSNGVYYVDIPVYTLLSIAVFAYLVLHAAFFFTRRRQSHGSLIKTLCIVHNGRTAKLRALLDTGNLARDPATGNAVVMAEWDKLRHLFDGKGPEADASFTLIPYDTIAGGGALMAFVPDALYLIEGKPVPLEGLSVGIVSRTLDKNKEYHAILPDVSA